MRGVGKSAQYVSCFASASVVRDGGSSAVEDAMRHRRIATRCHHRGVWCGFCVWNVRASSLQSSASSGTRGNRYKKNYSPLSLSLSHSLLLSFTFVVRIRFPDAHHQATGLLVLLPFYHFFSPIFTVLFSFLSFVPQFSLLYFIKLEFLFVSVAMKSRDFNETCVSRVTCSCYLSYTHLYLACVPLYLEPMSIGSPTSTLYYSLDWLQV